MELDVQINKTKDEIINCQKHETAIIDLPCKIGHGTKIWHFSHIRENCKIGQNCSFGQNTYVANGVSIGDNVKVQNNVSIYEGVIVEDDVFIGPGVTFTNVRQPWVKKPTKDFEVTLIKRGASIGANSTILCGVVIGEGAMVGCGAVVNRNVQPRTLVAGNPARLIKHFEEN